MPTTGTHFTIKPPKMLFSLIKKFSGRREVKFRLQTAGETYLGLSPFAFAFFMSLKTSNITVFMSIFADFLPQIDFMMWGMRDCVCFRSILTKDNDVNAFRVPRCRQHIPSPLCKLEAD